MGWISFVIVALILASIIAGQSSAPSGTTGAKNCKECDADFAWYRSLSKVKKVAYSVWWVARKAACAANGC
jgi:hypothetical protein